MVYYFCQKYTACLSIDVYTFFLQSDEKDILSFFNILFNDLEFGRNCLKSLLTGTELD